MKKPHPIAIFALASILLAIASRFAPSEPSTSASSSSSDSSKPSNSSHSAPIADDAFSPYSPEQYPKTYAKFGSRMDDVQKGREQAAKAASRSKKCDEVLWSEVSMSKSTVDNLQFWVDCANGNRFTFSESQLSDTTVATGTAQDQAPDLSTVSTACRKLIRDDATHPSTVSINHFAAGASYQTYPTGSASIVMPFKAKNSFGTELKFNARCVMQADGRTEITITEQGQS